MNIKKNIDYSAMFAVLDALIAECLSQLELYYEIGRIVSGQHEKGAAVAAAEHLQRASRDVRILPAQPAKDAAILPRL